MWAAVWRPAAITALGVAAGGIWTVYRGNLQRRLLLHRVSLGGQEWSPDNCKDACQLILSDSLHKISEK